MKRLLAPLLFLSFFAAHDAIAAVSGITAPTGGNTATDAVKLDGTTSQIIVTTPGGSNGTITISLPSSALWTDGNATVSSTTPANRHDMGVNTDHNYSAYFGAMYLNSTGGELAAVIGTRRAGTDTPGIYVRDGFVGIGTPAPEFPIDLRSDSNAAAVLRRYSDTDSARALLQFQKYGGTQASPTGVVADEKLGSVIFAGYDGSAVQAGGLVEAFVDGSVSSGSVPTRVSVVTGSNSGDRAERLVVKSDGKVGIGTSSPGQKLTVAGTIEITGGGNGLKFADGTVQTTKAAVDGSGSASRVAIWLDTDTLTFDSPFTWDSTNNYLGVNQASPAHRLDIENSSSGGTRVSAASPSPCPDVADLRRAGARSPASVPPSDRDGGPSAKQAPRSGEAPSEALQCRPWTSR